MFTRKTTTRVCSFCKAPNPSRLAQCYSCGSSLSDIDPNLPRQGETTYPCLNCHGEIPFRAPSCPHCGRAILPAERTRKPVAPKGWDAQALPDGSIALQRSQGTRWRTTAIYSLQLPCILALALGIGLFMPHGLIERGEETATTLLWVFAACVSVCIGGLLVALLMREDIRVGRDFLEVRRDLWRYRFQQRIEEGELRAKTEQRTISTLGGGERHSWVRTLYVADVGRVVALHEVVESVLLHGNGTMSHALAGDEIAQLALYLADITGWQIYDDIAA